METDRYGHQGVAKSLQEHVLSHVRGARSVVEYDMDKFWYIFSENGLYAEEGAKKASESTIRWDFIKCVRKPAQSDHYHCGRPLASCRQLKLM